MRPHVGWTDASIDRLYAVMYTATVYSMLMLLTWLYHHPWTAYEEVCSPHKFASQSHWKAHCDTRTTTSTGVQLTHRGWIYAGPLLHLHFRRERILEPQRSCGESICHRTLSRTSGKSCQLRCGLWERTSDSGTTRLPKCNGLYTICRFVL
jgi:hypothetical protein